MPQMSDIRSGLSHNSLHPLPIALDARFYRTSNAYVLDKDTGWKSSQGIKFSNLRSVSCPHIRPSMSSPSISSPLLSSPAISAFPSPSLAPLASNRDLCSYPTRRSIACNIRTAQLWIIPPNFHSSGRTRGFSSSGLFFFADYACRYFWADRETPDFMSFTNY